MLDNLQDHDPVDALVERLEAASPELFAVCDKHQLTMHEIQIIVRNWQLA